MKGGYLFGTGKGAEGVKPIIHGGICLLPQGVIPHSSHVKGGHCKGSGRKLGFYRGEGVSGDHGIVSWSPRMHGDDEWGLGSPGQSIKDGPGSTPSNLLYAAGKPEREGSFLWLPERSGTQAPPPIAVEGGALPWGVKPRGVRVFYMPDLSGAQLRAALRSSQGPIMPSYRWVAGNQLLYMPDLSVAQLRADLCLEWGGSYPVLWLASGGARGDDWRTGPRARSRAGMHQHGGRCVPGRWRSGPGYRPVGPGRRCGGSWQLTLISYTYRRNVPVVISGNVPEGYGRKVPFDGFSVITPYNVTNKALNKDKAGITPRRGGLRVHSNKKRGIDKRFKRNKTGPGSRDHRPRLLSGGGGGIISRNPHWKRPGRQGGCTRSRIPLYNTLLSE